jgi:hypothetical protein
MVQATPTEYPIDPPLGVVIMNIPNSYFSVTTSICMEI